MTFGRLPGSSLLFVAAAAACAPAAGPETPPTTTAVADPAFADATDSARTVLVDAAAKGVGLAVAVVVAGEPVWIEGAGWADLAEPRAVDPTRTRFRIYSVSKAMTAVAAARLMERGELDPDAAVQRYVPSFPEKRAPITPMQLAMHTSGVRHYAEGEARGERHCATVDDALGIFADDPLLHEPGEAETYSSWGYVLLSAVLEAITGEAYAEAMRTLVFEPAGMTATAIDDPTMEVAGRASFYDEVAGEPGPAEPVDNTCKWGAGAWLATAPDVARFGAAMLDGTLVSARSLQLFLRGQDSYRAQGLGAGGAAFLLIDAEHDVSIALLSNAIGEEAGPAAQEALGWIHARFTSGGQGGA